ncbi:putative signal transducing protein [Membranihabitans maritimus]|uniref:putative signal transducing protein n=1 Tax=Membranihabitans maritimus TaxID=2904244 RepID=UPI001F3E8668|nr:DUF2007 domain-containing protein [Membranihabitans maritimus]
MKLVYSTQDRIVANIIKNELESQEIESVLMDKKDSAINSFGYLEIYVVDDKLEIAKGLIDEILARDEEE